jgi:hypothetical protein
MICRGRHLDFTSGNLNSRGNCVQVVFSLITLLVLKSGHSLELFVVNYSSSM